METFLYIGQDQNYYKHFKQSLEKEFPKKKFGLYDLDYSRESDLYRTLNVIISVEPDLILLDFTEFYTDRKKLFSFLRQSFPLKKIPIIGIIAHNFEFSIETILTGLKYFHFKGREFSEILFIHQYEQAKKQSVTIDLPKIFKKKMNGTCHALHFLRINKLTSQHINVESDLIYEKGYTYRFENNFIKFLFKVAQSKNFNLYYQLKNSYVLKIINPIKRTTNFVKTCLNSSIREIAKIQNNIEKTYAHYLNFITRDKEQPKKTKSNPKRTRVHIIDSQLAIIKQSKKELDEYNISLRVDTEIDMSFHQLRRILPGVIALVINKKDYSTENKKFNLLINIKSLIIKINKMSGYEPIIIVFDQHNFLKNENIYYKRFLKDKSSFTIEHLLLFSSMYENKHGKLLSHKRTYKSDFTSDSFYLSKKDSKSILKFPFIVEVLYLSEKYVMIKSKISMEPGIVLNVDINQKFWITILDWKYVKDFQYIPKSNIYVGLIHGLDERQKTSLRKFLNVR